MPKPCTYTPVPTPANRGIPRCDRCQEQNKKVVDPLPFIYSEILKLSPSVTGHTPCAISALRQGLMCVGIPSEKAKGNRMATKTFPHVILHKLDSTRRLPKPQTVVRWQVPPLSTLVPPYQLAVLQLFHPSTPNPQQEEHPPPDVRHRKSTSPSIHHHHHMCRPLDHLKCLDLFPLVVHPIQASLRSLTR